MEVHVFYKFHNAMLHIGRDETVLNALRFLQKQEKTKEFLHCKQKGGKQFPLIHIEHYGHKLDIVDGFTKFVRRYTTKTKST